MMAAVGLLILLVLGAPGAEAASLKALLSPEQAKELAMKLAERRPFLDSVEANSRQGRQTMGFFFKDDDYRVLNGNPVFGYWDAGGFRWTGNRISWQGIVSVGKACKAIPPRAWDLAFGYVAEKHGLIIERAAPLRLQGACVWAVTEPSPKDPVPGVVMEMRLDSPSGTFRWRYSRANPTIEGAIGAAVELPILIGKKINQEGGGTHAD
jgi:hypothetical protein